MNMISHIIRLPIPAALALKLIHDSRIAHSLHSQIASEIVRAADMRLICYYDKKQTTRVFKFGVVVGRSYLCVPFWELRKLLISTYG